MITQIRIDGFKSFRDFTLDVPPTLVMLGPNGAGKSNLFDALRLVAGTADRGFEATVREDPRLSPGGLFHRGGAGTAHTLAVTVGTLVASQDGPLPVRIRLRVGRTPGGQVAVLAKSAIWISRLEDDGWMANAGLDEEARSAVREARSAFLDRVGGPDYLPFKGMLGTPWDPRAPHVLGEDAEDEGERYAEDFVAAPGEELRALTARECASWHPFVLEPAALRTPTAALATGRISPDGANLAAVLHRVRDESPSHWRRFVADLAALVDGVRDIRPLHDRRRDEYDFEVEFSNTGWISPPALSDGTLRMIALLAAAVDPLWPGGMCVEEIENGMHPGHVADLVRRLRRGTGVTPGAPTPYRQLIATTHSPALLAALRDDVSGSLVFMEQADHVDPHEKTVTRTTVARPLRAYDPERNPGETVSPEHVERLLRNLGRRTP
ncbi:AAA family ATPase [Streptomyces sp. H27-S2]|uniref:AAA family ATPase n=1 Tax=Streptomyces antarcticus TaxID=2996458 RepID=UPI00226D57B7|nr:AAA family ATPase [Streptomyces sp. H27-S2]MCY0948239.1 AAA family ATPase [Streptomyces sp. H27-S2]